MLAAALALQHGYIRLQLQRVMAHHQVPPVGSRTLCELQCQLLTVPAGERGALPGPACPDADLGASATTTTQTLGGYTPAVVKCPSGQWPPYAADNGSWDSDSGAAGSPAGLHVLLQQLLRRLLVPAAAARLEELLGLQYKPLLDQALAWHPCQPLLAALDGKGRVQIHDYAGQLPLLGQGGGGAAPPTLHPTKILQHEVQQQASTLGWRPFGGKCLAVGVLHGACLWHIGHPSAGSSSRSDSGAWMTWLKAPSAGPITTLAWHPQGHLLAAAAPQSSAGFHVWHVATGTTTPISAGPEVVTLLRWSPCGTYLLAGHMGGAFRIWQTQTWWSQHWAASQGGGTGGSGMSGAGELVEACWGPDCRSLVLSYEHSPQLVSVHFTGEAPSLQAQLLPLPLAELSVKGLGQQSGGLVQAMAWDCRAQRLAVAIGGAHPAAGCVALYDTRCDPILSARFIGFMRLGPLQQPLIGVAGASALPRHSAAAEAGWEEIQPEEVAEAAGAVGGPAAAAAAQRGGGNPSLPAAAALAAASTRSQLAFLCGFAQGAVLAVRTGDRVAAVPLYFAA